MSNTDLTCPPECWMYLPNPGVQTPRHTVLSHRLLPNNLNRTVIASVVRRHNKASGARAQKKVICVRTCGFLGPCGDKPLSSYNHSLIRVEMNSWFHSTCGELQVMINSIQPLFTFFGIDFGYVYTAFESQFNHYFKGNLCKITELWSESKLDAKSVKVPIIMYYKNNILNELLSFQEKHEQINIMHIYKNLIQCVLFVLLKYFTFKF